MLRCVTTPTVSEIASEAPIAVIRNASGGALRRRSGRYATSSTNNAVIPEATIAADQAQQHAGRSPRTRSAWREFWSSPNQPHTIRHAKVPSRNTSEWAKLISRSTPYTSV